jgi:enoyl-CoA hydratase
LDEATPTPTPTTGEGSVDQLSVRHERGAMWLTLDRPDRLNALTGDMVAELVHQLHAAARRDDVRVVVLTGSGPAFCAGADLGGDHAQDRYDAGSVDRANALVRAVTELDKPVVCALNGVAAGVGLSLALACDLVVATESATLTLAFTKVGLMPDGGATATVAAAVGRARAMRLALLSDPLSARAAYDAGLVSHVAPDAEYAQVLEQVVGRLVDGPPLAYAATKKAVNAATLGALDAAFERERSGQGLLLRTDDVAEGVRAFVEKRRATFRGR